MRPIIGFIGYARVGKDTAASALTSRGFQRVAFADALKLDCEKIIGMPIAAMTPEQKEFWRPLMVEYGRLRRAQHEDFWVWQVECTLRTVEPSTPVCITDVRYANECRWILEQGGTLVMVTRPGYNAANDEEAHSILEIMNSDWIFDKVTMLPNTGEIAQLKRRTVDIAHQKLGIP
jgi:hypothetical protein